MLLELPLLKKRRVYYDAANPPMPDSRVLVDWDHPLAQRCLTFQLPTYTGIRDVLLEGVGEPSLAPSLGGLVVEDPQFNIPALRVSEGTHPNATLERSPFAQGRVDFPFTLIGRQSQRSEYNNNTSVQFGLRNFDSFGQVLSLYNGWASQFALGFYMAGTWGNRMVYRTGVPNNEFHTVGATVRDFNVDMDFYYDGGTSTPTFGGVADTGGNNVITGIDTPHINRISGLPQQSRIDVSFFMAFTGELDAEQHASLANDPFQFLYYEDWEPASVTGTQLIQLEYVKQAETAPPAEANRLVETPKALAVFNGSTELPPTVSGTPIYGVTNDALQYLYTDGVDDTVGFDDLILQDYTLIWAGVPIGNTPNSNPGEAAIGADNYPASPRHGFIFKPWNVGNGRVEAYIDGTGGVLDNLRTVCNIQLNEFTTLVAVRRDTSIHIWVNGVFGGTITVGAAPSSLTNLILGGHYYSGGVNETYEAQHMLFSILDNAVSDDRAEELGLNPWALFYKDQESFSPLEATIKWIDQPVDESDPESGYIDYFEHDLDPDWTLFTPTGNGDYWLDGQNMRIAVPGGATYDLWSTNKDGLRLIRPINGGDFLAETQIVDLPPADGTSNLVGGGLVAHADLNNFIRCDVVVNSPSGAYTVYFIPCVGGAAFVQNSSQVFIAPNRRVHLRLGRTGTLYSAQFSVDGVNWTSLGTYNTAMGIDHIGLTSMTVSAAPYFEAAYTHFAVDLSEERLLSDSSAPFSWPNPKRIERIPQLISTAAASAAVEFVIRSLTSTPEVDALTLTQLHALTLGEITSTPELDAISLQAALDLIIGSVEITPELQSSILTAVMVLTTSAVEVTPEEQSIALTLIKVLTSGNVESTPELDGVVATLVHVLASSAVESTPEIQSAALTVIYTLLAGNVEAAATIDASTLISVYNLISSSIESTPEVASILLSTGIMLAIASVEAQPELAAVALTQVHALVTNNIEVEPEISQLLLTLIHILAVNSMDVTPSLSSAELVQIHLLVLQTLAVTGEIDSISLAQASQLLFGDINVTPELVATSITQDQYLQIQDVLVTPTIRALIAVDPQIGVLPLVTSTIRLNLDGIQTAVAVGYSKISIITGLDLPAGSLPSADWPNWIFDPGVNISPSPFFESTNVDGDQLDRQSRLFYLGENQVVSVASIANGADIYNSYCFSFYDVTDFTVTFSHAQFFDTGPNGVTISEQRFIANLPGTDRYVTYNPAESAFRFYQIQGSIGANVIAQGVDGVALDLESQIDIDPVSATEFLIAGRRLAATTLTLAIAQDNLDGSVTILGSLDFDTTARVETGEVSVTGVENLNIVQLSATHIGVVYSRRVELAGSVFARRVAAVLIERTGNALSVLHRNDDVLLGINLDTPFYVVKNSGSAEEILVVGSDDSTAVSRAGLVNMIPAGGIFGGSTISPLSIPIYRRFGCINTADNEFIMIAGNDFQPTLQNLATLTVSGNALTAHESPISFADTDYGDTQRLLQLPGFRLFVAYNGFSGNPGNRGAYVLNGSL